jgi:hypothetical protein
MKSPLLLSCLALCLAGSTAALADTITFETLPPGPPGFSATVPMTVTVDGVTFTGGTILTNEAGGVDLTNVYATCGLGSPCGSGYGNPITLTFSSPVFNLNLLVTNDISDTYTLTDNFDKTVSFFAPAVDVEATLSLTDSGVTSATITASLSSGWDFAIDNVNFNVPTPEPASVLLVAGGLAAIARRIRARK